MFELRFRIKRNEYVIEKIILKISTTVKIFYTKYKIQNIDEFKNKKITAFAGIGNPENFFTLLKDNNINVVKEIKFPDHYNYTKNELENIITETKKNSEILVTTEKDFMRIDEDYKKDINYLKISVDIKNRDKFIEEIKKII